MADMPQSSNLSSSNLEESESEKMLKQLLEAITEVAHGNFNYQLNLKSQSDSGQKLGQKFSEQFEQMCLSFQSELEAKEILSQNEARYRSLLEVSQDPIIMYDDVGRATYINPAFAQTFGWSIEELLGKRIEFVPEENQAETEVAITKVFTEGKASVETKRLTKDGRLLDVLISASLHSTLEGKPIGIEAILRDISERKQAEEVAHRRVEREQTIREITEKMRLTTTLQDLVRVAATELGQRLSAAHAVLELGIEPSLSLNTTTSTTSATHKNGNQNGHKKERD